MDRIALYTAGVATGLVITFFTSLLTELILLGVVAVVVIYFGRKRWSTHSTTKTSQSSSPSHTDPL